ncbi:Hypothetical protein PHPALM_9803 [Phytophthora palmivora]|uniref:CFA20 domain-containing protein n=1 Tax=Phytophthora palmivora TaxID=4796 RepID=A0A2P4Y6D7_9STRA|nr:Hypothetical protein PHPALM_9803 [Phytophthora palmivora]
MAYFHGGDYVELLSAQGKAPAASWKLQGKISKTFDKGIKGNAFTLDGNSETKMQLPKTASSSLGLAQRFVILQLLVPFTRSFSVEICYSDFQKVRRRFVVASAFRDTTRTTLHVQLPLNSADVPRDQWINLVFDLQMMSEIYFPDTGYRSMESVCVSGSCRLKRIFTMKDAPTPSRGSNVIRHADIRDIPRQFVFSATQRGISGASPIPTLYFSSISASGIGGIHGIAVGATPVGNSNQKSSRRNRTAPLAKPQAKGKRTVRPTSELLHRKTPAPPQPVTPSNMDADNLSGQRLRTPARVGSKFRQPHSSIDKVVVVQRENYLRDSESPSPTFRVAASSHERIFDDREMAMNSAPRNMSPVRVQKSQDVKTEQAMIALSPEPTVPPELTVPTPRSLNRALSPPSSALSSVMMSPKELQPELRSRTLRQSILGEIQQKIASLEADDERADQRDRELFLRHTSLHSGEWHLQKLRDDDLDVDGALLSDDEDCDIQLSSSWRREMTEQTTSTFLATSSSEVAMHHHNPDDKVVKTSVESRNYADKESIFSFSSMEPETMSTRERTPRLFDFDSLLQDVEPLTAPQPVSSTITEPPIYKQLENRIETALADAESDADDLELVKLLAAKRSARHLPITQDIGCDEGTKAQDDQKLTLPETHQGNMTIDNDSNELEENTQEVAQLRDADFIAGSHGEKDDWVVVDMSTADPALDPTINTNELNQEKEIHFDQQSDEDSDVDIGGDITGLSMDLTSELSASGGESERDFRHDDEFTGPASPQTDESKLDEIHKSSNHRDDGDEASSFDFDDIVDNAELSDDRDEKEGKHDQITVSVTTDKSEQRATRASRDFNPKLASSPQKNQVLREKRRAPPVPPRRMTSVNSPLINSRENIHDELLLRKSREKSLKSSSAIELSSSFSSRRLQSLLESTDWTAELNAQGNNSLSTSSSHNLSPRRISNRKQRHHASSTDISTGIRSSKDSTNRSLQPPSTRPQTPLTSSIELVYDPRLRCYYDPITNKYYALAE